MRKVLSALALAHLVWGQTTPGMRLEQFQQLALANSPALREANATAAQAAGESRQAGLYPNPTIGYQGEQIRGGSFGGGEQGAFIEQTIVLAGKLGLRRSVYDQERRASEIGIEEQRYRLLSDVGQSFYAVLVAQQIVDVRKHLRDLSSDALLTARELANVGQSDAPDVLQSEAALEQAELDYETAQRTFRQAFRILAAVCGKPEMPLTPLAGDLEPPPQIDEASAIDQVMQGSPAIKRAQQEVARAEAELRSAKRESVPDLQIRAGLEQNFEQLNNPARTPVGVQAFASAGVTLPVFNRNQGNIAAASAKLERAQAEVDRTKLAIRRSMASVLESYAAALSEAHTYHDEILPRAQRAYEMYLAKYRDMAAAYPQVLISQRTYFDSQIRYWQALQTVWSNAVLLQNYGLSSGLDGPALR